MHIIKDEHGNLVHHGHEHIHEHTHEDGVTHSHIHSHENGEGHEHTHGHEHSHEHTHEDGVTHSHAHSHENGEGHEHTHECSEGHCGSCEGGDCKNETVALLTYMLQHNEHHAAELDQMAENLQKMGMDAAAKTIKDGVADFEKGNMRLSLALTLVKEEMKEK